MPAMTRGPLPARVYWVRRMLVVATAVLLVVGIARLLGSDSDATSGPDDQAAQSAAETTPDASSSAPLTQTGSSEPTKSTGANPGQKSGSKNSDKASSMPVLVEPDGPCANSDVAVTPKVEQAVAGRNVLVVLQLRTLTSPACTWQVSNRALTVDITSGDEDIWSSRQCPRAIPVRDVVVRKDVTTNVGVVWTQAKRSGDRCVLGTDWAYPGAYHVTAAALGGEPSDLQFELTTPTATTITKTAKPTNSPSSEPSGSPSGAATPH